MSRRWTWWTLVPKGTDRFFSLIPFLTIVWDTNDKALEIYAGWFFWMWVLRGIVEVTHAE